MEPTSVARDRDRAEQEAIAQPSSPPELAHILLYGPPGTGKSELAASIPGTKLIALWDPIGHAQPYLRSYANHQTRDVVLVRNRPSIIPTIDSYDKTDHSYLRQRLWHFGADLTGKLQFDVKRAILISELEKINASVFIFDSLTMFTTAMRVLSKQQGIADDEQAAYAMTDYVEQLAVALASLPVATVLIAHISDQSVKFRGTIVRKENYVNAPGRMARNLKSMFSNVWYCSVTEDSEFIIQTRTQGDHEARNSYNSPAIVNHTLGEGYTSVTKYQEPLIWI